MALTGFAPLEEAYSDLHRAARERKQSGGKVIGCLGNDVPEELVIAAGMLPVRIYGDPLGGDAMAERYEKGFNPQYRSQFTRLLDGSYPYLDHLLVSNSSYIFLEMFYTLDMIRQTEPDMRVPDLYLYDCMMTRYRSSLMYNRDRLKELKQHLETWKGSAIGEQDIREAIRITNENRRLLRQLNELRLDRPRITGTQFLKAVITSAIMDRKAHSALLASCVNEAAGAAPLEGAKLFVTGSIQDHTYFYELVESCGAVIVGEDHDLGCRNYNSDIDESLDWVEGISDYYQFRTPSMHQSTVTERVKALTGEVKRSGAEGVIFYIYKSDDPALWEYPEERRALEEMGVPTLVLQNQPYGLDEAAASELRTKISEFVQQRVQGGNVRGRA
jgi:benzoyl-CoA reductase/2-hydroxyglutaryl-CoA dehydratase subunit BcrC/BadD/HgdB